MSVKTFVDTNIFLYAYDKNAEEKHEITKGHIKTLWENMNGVISTQVKSNSTLPKT